MFTASASRLKCIVLSALLGLLPGCVAYHPRPLPDDAGLLTDLTMARLPDRNTVALDFEDGLTPDEAAVVAVLNNPGLRAVRAKAGVADAQLFAAGLFPDPQLTLGFDNPTSNAPDLSHALALSIGIDVAALVSHSPANGAAEATAQQARLDVLWQEWQVASLARITATRFAAESKKLSYLDASVAQFQGQSNAALQALQHGDMTVDVAATEFSSMLDATSARYQLRLQHSATRSALNALLGVVPDVVLDVVWVAPPQPWPRVDMTAVAAKRPDLLALRAGYQSQEARLRQAVWSQFPVISLNWNRLRDTSDIWSSGLSTVLNLPLLSGNRGDIAIQQATRAQLREEYTDRLAQSNADIAKLLTDGALQQRHLRALQKELPKLAAMAAQAAQGAGSGDLAAVISAGLQTTLIGKQLEAIDVEQALWETRIALDTLLGQVSP